MEMGPMLKKLFVEHPQSVGESYVEHMGVAFGFAFKLMSAGVMCFIHGLVPGLFKTGGSQAIIVLHDRMVANRCGHTSERGGAIASRPESTLG
jgi:hypothetical protein